MNRSDFLQALGKTFSVGRVLGFDIRVHWSAFFVLLYLIHINNKLYALEPGGSAPVILGIAAFAMLYAIILVHELGHALAARSLGLGIQDITLNPIGGQANLSTPPRSPREELIVTVWGPAVHPVLIALISPFYICTHNETWDFGFYGNELVSQFFWLNVFLLGFNLLPAFPMDGGRILRALLARRTYAAKATIVAAYIGQVVSVIFVVVAFTQGGEFKWLLAIIGAMNLLVCEREKNLARHYDPYESSGGNEYGLNYYEPDPADYRDYRDDDDARAERTRPGFVTRYFQERARKRQEAEAREKAAMRLRVDELLEKVSRVGMAGLTPEERRFLDKASDAYRNSP